MKLVVINGSPRRERGNTEIILKYFLNGFLRNKNNTSKSIHLTRIKDISYTDIKKSMAEADRVIVGFPLYIDAMPAVVKEFFESLEDSKSEYSIGFIVQSGYPDAAHSKYIEAYLKKISKQSGWDYLGTVVRGGMEGIRDWFSWIFNGFMYIWCLNLFYRLGKIFGETGSFDERIVNRLLKSRTFLGLDVWKLFNSCGITKLYWNMFLIKNCAFGKRFNRPYQMN
ncbi:MAG: NAD(P)H-dependent oxidoreductase [Candidatus Omnitrophica bacterium]|nr:NAD(P)H-dependent oxidoreductase [Candidatus Omnitrophota bacterium]MBU1929757.1 NAD(P)H-dependent oxidoreductase [Candidatus Omnitrophota bacterium]MBU2034920.1 NAD(P)H-dependent oxidoreductase [Candidatus Omnitrophota bacterium]MBU2258268.1 NAD(P)H-dependent oxidoreductase [Candidatus Omnitrophota bacterium]